MKPQDEPSAKGTHFQFGPCYAFALVDASLFCLFHIQLQVSFLYIVLMAFLYSV